MVFFDTVKMSGGCRIHSLNLDCLEQSDIKYKISKFPDGQQNVSIEGLRTGKLLPSEQTFGETIQIHSRFNSFLNLELIIAATKALNNMGIVSSRINLEIPYILGARSDRAFGEGDNSYLRDVVAPIINAQGYNKVICYDVHSMVAQAVIPNLQVIDNSNLVKWALKDVIAQTPVGEKSEAVLVAPDAGAQHKIFALAKKIEFEGRIITCAKERDLKTGQILETRIDGIHLFKDFNKSFVIIDDICDGGRTFIEIAKVLKHHFPWAHVHLVVSHGIFSAGFAELKKYFNTIHCTDSVRSKSEYGSISCTGQKEELDFLKVMEL